MQWVSVNERLPEYTMQKYLVCFDGKIMLGIYSKYRVWHVGNGIVEITHWMPLPEPPTASNNEFKATDAP